MIVDLMLVLLLIFAFYRGYSRGVLIQSIYSFGLVIAAIISGLSYKAFVPLVSSWFPTSTLKGQSQLLFFEQDMLTQIHPILVSGLSFIIVFALVYIILRVIAIFIKWSPVKLLKRGKILGGILALLTSYLALQMLVVFASLIPQSNIQEMLHQSFLAQLMVLYTPLFSDFIQKFFIETLAQIKL
ncbi:MAG: CvpA family protein [Streptococcaceae bacterium]|nr:CvpA family protein [Streptococcaceae bacterium]